MFRERKMRGPELVGVDAHVVECHEHGNKMIKKPKRKNSVKINSKAGRRRADGKSWFVLIEVPLFPALVRPFISPSKAGRIDQSSTVQGYHDIKGSILRIALQHEMVVT